METSSRSYHREFVRSPHHAWLGFLTLGVGFLSAQPFIFLLGATAYGLGWIYLPDLPLFKRWVDRRFEAAQRTAALAQVAEFVRKREALLNALAVPRRVRYTELTEVCADIEKATTENPLAAAGPGNDPRLRKLDELMWTFLRLLGIEESLERFLETEQREDVPTVVREAEAEVGRLNAEIEALKAKGNSLALETKQRLLSSRFDRLEVLKKRLERIEQTHANLALVLAEQDRLTEQVKLIRADAVASKNAETLTARIDATVEHLDQTNKWLSELDEFKDLVGDMPATEFRLGYEAAGAALPEALAAPPRITAPAERNPRSRLPNRER